MLPDIGRDYWQPLTTDRCLAPYTYLTIPRDPWWHRAIRSTLNFILSVLRRDHF